MTEFLLVAASDAELDPIYVRLLLFGVGSVILLYANYQLRRGGAYCHTGMTKFSPTRFYAFEEAPFQTRFHLLIQFVAAALMVCFALIGIG